MKTIQITIPELQNETGSIKWVTEKLESIALTLKAGTTRDGEPALTYEHWKDKKPDGMPKRYIICYIPSNDDFSGYVSNDSDSNVMRLASCARRAHEGLYLFPVLTKQAIEIVEDYLNQLCEAFYEEYNNN